MSMQSDIDEPSWPEILIAVQNQLQARIHTQLPGIVKSYDSATQVATVQLAIQLDGETLPPLADVPVVWPGGAAGFLHVPLAEGDTVLVLFAEEDFSKWLESGSISAPAVLARHGLHAVAIPGLRRTPFAATGGHVTLASTGELRLGADAASVFVALASLVDARLTALQAAFDAHTHLYLPPPAPLAAIPTAPPVPLVGPLATTAATKVKAV